MNNPFGELWRRIQFLFRRRGQFDRDLEEEIRLHLEHRAEEQAENNDSSEEEARYAARRQFGNTTQIKETSRELWGWRWFETLLQDLRYATRLMRKSPAVTFLAVLCLALGIGVNTSIFSFLNFLFLRSLPVPDADRIVTVSRGDSSSFSYPNYLDYRDRNRSLTGLAAYIPTESSLDWEDHGQLISAEAVSANYGEVIGVRPFAGRWFTSEDEPVAVISYSAWRRLFNADLSVLGKRIRSEKQWYTVIGIAPPEFSGMHVPLSADLWMPLRIWASQHGEIARQLEDRSRSRVMVFGRLKAAMTASQATADLNTIDEDLGKTFRDGSEQLARLSVTSVHGMANSEMRRSAAPVMTLLMAVVALVLLIACVNVGNLMVARGAARRREISMRLALGASRARIFGQLMIESTLLALLGSIGGLVLGSWANRLLEISFPSLPLPETIRPILSLDLRVIAFTTAIGLLTTLLFGLLPALHSTKIDVLTTLKGELGRSSSRFRLRHASVVAQVALSLVLLLSAGLFLRLLLHLQTVDSGFAVKNRFYAWTYVSPPEFTAESGRQFYRDAVDRLREVPGVRSAALADFLPLQNPGSDCISIGQTKPVRSTTRTVDVGYFSTSKIPLLEGRDFAPIDAPNSPPVVIVNQTLAHRLWPHQSAVGKQLQIGCDKTTTANVVGVVRDSKIRSLNEEPHPHFYQPFSQHYTGLATIIVETMSNSGAMEAAIRRELLNVNRAMRIYAVKPLSEHVEQSYWQTRWQALILAAFGLLALLLAAVGLYGVISYHVTLRTREIGVRMAIGANSGSVSGLILRQGLTLTVIGVLIGLVVSIGFAKLLAKFFIGLQPTDPVVLGAVSLLWILVALLAAYLPARRAARIDPMVALRYE